MVRNMIELRVFEKKLVSKSADGPDLIERIDHIHLDWPDCRVNKPETVYCGGTPFTFILKNDEELAKSVSAGSVIMPFVQAGTGPEIQISKMPQPLPIEVLNTTIDPAQWDGLWVNAVVNPIPLPKHESDKQCGDCLLFDHKKGLEELNRETHVFSEGETGKMNLEVVDAMAKTYGRPTLSNDNVGYCPKLVGLCSKRSPACDDWEEK